MEVERFVNPVNLQAFLRDSSDDDDAMSGYSDSSSSFLCVSSGKKFSAIYVSSFGAGFGAEKCCVRFVSDCGRSPFIRLALLRRFRGDPDKISSESSESSSDKLF